MCTMPNPSPYREKCLWDSIPNLVHNKFAYIINTCSIVTIANYGEVVSSTFLKIHLFLNKGNLSGWIQHFANKCLHAIFDRRICLFIIILWYYSLKSQLWVWCLAGAFTSKAKQGNSDLSRLTNIFQNHIIYWACSLFILPLYQSIKHIGSL